MSLECTKYKNWIGVWERPLTAYTTQSEYPKHTKVVFNICIFVFLLYLLLFSKLFCVANHVGNQISHVNKKLAFNKKGKFASKMLIQICISGQGTFLSILWLIVTCCCICKVS